MVPFSERTDIRALREAIIDHEHALEWNEALTCYEQLLDRMHKDGVRFTRPGAAQQQQQQQQEQEQEEGAQDRRRGSEEERIKLETEKEIYLGIMKSLGKSGHYETLMHHAMGAMQSSGSIMHQHHHGGGSDDNDDDFMEEDDDVDRSRRTKASGGARGRARNLTDVVAPFAMEASWRLGRWDMLEHLLEVTTGTVAMGARGGPPSSSSSLSSLLRRDESSSIADTDQNMQRSYMVHTAVALLALHHGEITSMHAALSDARMDVMGALSAASMESYDQAYPMLLKLHSLHEIEESVALHTCSSVTEQLRHVKTTCR